jgi:hypothetical protein
MMDPIVVNGSSRRFFESVPSPRRLLSCPSFGRRMTTCWAFESLQVQHFVNPPEQGDMMGTSQFT